MKLNLVIKGKIPSKKNRLSISHGKVYQDGDVKSWMEAAYYEILSQVKLQEPMAGSLNITVTFYTDRRSDLDNQLSTIFDLLQYSKVIKNDRQIDFIIAHRDCIDKDIGYLTKISLSTSGDNSG